MKQGLFVPLIALFCAFSLHAQSNEVIGRILSGRTLSAGELCYMAACATGQTDDTAVEDAFRFFKSGKGSLRKVPSASSAVTLLETADVISKVWDLNGGGGRSILYAATKSPRYALRKLMVDKAVPSSFDPSRLISGREFMDILTYCMEKYPLAEPVLAAASSDEGGGENTDEYVSENGGPDADDAE